MNKTELVAQIVERTGLKKADAVNALDAVLASVTDALIAGDRVQLIGFGTFKVSERAARQGKNPATGEVIQIAARKVPSFSAGSELKDSVNK